MAESRPVPLWNRGAALRGIGQGGGRLTDGWLGGLGAKGRAAARLTDSRGVGLWTGGGAVARLAGCRGGALAASSRLVWSRSSCKAEAKSAKSRRGIGAGNAAAKTPAAARPGAASAEGCAKGSIGPGTSVAAESRRDVEAAAISIVSRSDVGAGSTRTVFRLSPASICPAAQAEGEGQESN